MFIHIDAAQQHTRPSIIMLIVSALGILSISGPGCTARLAASAPHTLLSPAPSQTVSDNGGLQAIEITDPRGDGRAVEYTVKVPSSISIGFRQGSGSGDLDHWYRLASGKIGLGSNAANSNFVVDRQVADYRDAGVELLGGWAATVRPLGFAPVRTVRVRPIIASITTSIIGGDAQRQQDAPLVVRRAAMASHQQERATISSEMVAVLACARINGKHYVFVATSSPPVTYADINNNSLQVEIAAGEFAYFDTKANPPRWSLPQPTCKSSLIAGDKALLDILGAAEVQLDVKFRKAE